MGAPRWLVPFAQSFLLNPVAVTLATWSVVILEFLLSAGLLMPKRRWKPLLLLGLSLHAGILVVQGLFSFSLAMAGALVLYLRPTEEPFFAGQEIESTLTTDSCRPDLARQRGALMVSSGLGAHARAELKRGYFLVKRNRSRLR